MNLTDSGGILTIKTRNESVKLSVKFDDCLAKSWKIWYNMNINRVMRMRFQTYSHFVVLGKINGFVHLEGQTAGSMKS